MSALTLPPPVNSSVGEDNLLAASGASPAANGTASGSGTPSNGDGKKSSELLQGIIYPPKEIRAIIDKTAIHIAKSPSPQMLEDRIREHQKSDPKFSFLRDGDAFNRYYRYMIEKVKEDGEEAVLASQSAATASAGAAVQVNGASTPAGVVVGTPVAVQQTVKKENQLEEPKPLEFVAELPNVTALDLDILRLTALFVARRGPNFLRSLSVKEGRNFQFDFLRPTHSLFPYFNRMVDSYSKVLNPSTQLLASLAASRDESDKWEVLEEAKKRGEWEKARREKDKKREEEKEKEMIAFAEIDWQDFVVVQTIEFTSTDQTIDLPPPTTIREMEKLTLNERKMAALIVEEVGHRSDEQANGVDEDAEMEVEMDEESDDEETKDRKRKEQEEIQRAREVQAKAMGQAGMKIRKDYVPKGLAARQTGKVATTICPYCKQAIPENEISEHIRIELLDPKWKEQKQLMDQKRTQAAQLMQGADVSASLKQLASARTDLFGTAEDEEARKRQEDEERAARKAKETIIWDGHTASKATTLDTFQNKYNLEDQIQSIHKKHALVPTAGPTVGPQLGTPGPQAIPPAQAAGASTPGGGTAFSGAVISAGPQGPSAPQPPQPPQSFYQPYPDQSQFQPFHDQPAFDPSVFNMPSMPPQQPGPDGLPPPPVGLPTKPPLGGIHPSRLAAMGGASPGMPNMPAPYVGSPYGQAAGQVRPHEDDGTPDGSAPAKRQKVEKLPTGQLYPESEWIRLHPEPVSVSVQLPNMPEKPEWKLNGSIITLEDVPVNFLVSTLRERIKNIIDAPLPISRMKLDYGTKTLSNSSTLASMNIGDGDMLSMSIRK